MLRHMLSSIRSCLPRSRGENMDKRKIVFTIHTTVSFGDEADWKQKVRAVRTAIKEAVSKDPAFKIFLVESKEG